MIMTALACLAVLVSHGARPDQPLDAGLGQWDGFSRSADSLLLKRWLRHRVFMYLAGTGPHKKLNVKTPEFFGRCGLFITILSTGKTRGCYGAFHHSSTDLETVLGQYIKGALTYDPREKPVDITDLNAIETILTVTSMPRGVEDLYTVDLKNNGVAADCAGSTVIFVPAEIKSHSYVMRLLKGKDCSFSAFRAVTIRQGHISPGKPL